LNSILQPHTHHIQPPTISSDGYIRLPLNDLSTLPFIHLASDSDSDFLAELQAQTIPALAAGFSEWMSETTPAISVGWGWYIHSPSRRLLLAPDAVRTNVMLTDIYGYDLGPTVTSNLFGSWLTIYDWQRAVSVALKASKTC
jgi:hypothetical protein